MDGGELGFVTAGTEALSSPRNFGFGCPFPPAAGFAIERLALTSAYSCLGR
jgi:hypothetical protein